VTTVTVYWRKRCPYCVRLRRQLRRIGLPTEERDIWSDPVAAATVREITGGDETVPTVVVGNRRMVNPDADTVLAAVRAEAPELLPPAASGRWWTRWLTRSPAPRPGRR
jgi:mycoredoxin